MMTVSTLTVNVSPVVADLVVALEIINALLGRSAM